MFKAHKVETGTTNGVLTEITGGIAEGTEVLTDFEISGGEMAMPQGAQGGNPFMPRPGNRNNNRGGAQGGQAGQAGQAGQGSQGANGGQMPRRQ